MVSLILPFSISTLQAALRRYLDQPLLEVGEVAPKKLGGGFSGSPVYRLRISYYEESGEPGEVGLVFKEGTQSTGTISYSVAGREAHFYRTLAHGLPVRTPYVVMHARDDIYLMADRNDSTVVGSGSFLGSPANNDDWVLIEALPQEGVWPQTGWSAENYREAIIKLATLHAHRWNDPPDRKSYPWIWEPTGAHAPALAMQAKEALQEIESAPWGKDFFSASMMREYMALLDNPFPLLDILNSLPQTLVHGDYWPGNIALKSNISRGESNQMTVFDWQFVGSAPAVYDLASFHATSRWWFGRLPYSLAEMRRQYLDTLNGLLGYKADIAISSAGLDAARAWRFVTLWPFVILQYHTFLLARKAYMKTTLLEPAAASLRRCMA